jgi:tetratricopeptide (TPR) repeat protein
LVDGLPLGIELAAGWIAVLEPRQIEGEIKKSLDILATEAGAVPDRQASLRGVFDASWSLLAEAEREAFAELAAFEGGFDLKAAQRVSRLSLQTLMALVNKSWVQPGAGGRFRFHDLLHRYGQEKLAVEPEREGAVRELHSDYYCDWISAQEADTWGPRQQTVLATIEADIENVHAACLWAAQKGRGGRLAAAVNALGLFYYQGQGNYQAGRSIFRSLHKAMTEVDAWSTAEPTEAGLLTATILAWQATFGSLIGDVGAVSRLLDEGSGILERYAASAWDTRRVRAHYAFQRGYLLLYPDPAEAARYHAQSLALYREVGDPWGTASALLGLGRAQRSIGALEEAEQTLTTSLALHRQMGNRHGESATLATLGGVAMIGARFEEAEDRIERSLSITPASDVFSTAFALGWLGATRMQAGRFSEAEEPLRECVALHRELGMWGYGARWAFSLAQVYIHQGRYDEARALAERIIVETKEMDSGRGTFLGLALFGEVALATGAFAEADRCLRESAEAAAAYTKDRYQHGQLAVLGLAARGLGRPVEAARLLRSALSETGAVHRFPVQMVALVGFSLLYADEGQAERAVELFSLASRYGFVANSIWLQDIVGGTLTAAAAGLSPDELRAARERSARLDLGDTVGQLLAGPPDRGVPESPLA